MSKALDFVIDADNAFNLENQASLTPGPNQLL